MLDLNPVRGKEKGQLYPFVYEAHESAQHWDTIEPFIEASCRVSYGTITPNIIRMLLQEGQACCMGTAREGEPVAILVVRMVDYPYHRSVRVIAAAGKELKEAMNFWHVLEVWAYTQGATEIEAWCRPAMTRMLQRFGFKPRLTMLTRDLKRMMQ